MSIGKWLENTWESKVQQEVKEHQESCGELNESNGMR